MEECKAFKPRNVLNDPTHTMDVVCWSCEESHPIDGAQSNAKSLQRFKREHAKCSDIFSAD